MTDGNGRLEWLRSDLASLRHALDDARRESTRQSEALESRLEAKIEEVHRVAQEARSDIWKIIWAVGGGIAVVSFIVQFFGSGLWKLLTAALPMATG